MKAVSVKMDEAQIAILDSMALANRSTALRRVITAGLAALAEQDEEIPSELDDRSRFILATEKYLHFARSCREAKVPMEDACAWLEEEGETGDQMRDAYEGAKETFLESLEFLIVEACRGERRLDKSAMTGLIAFLNNHHKNWGRVKIELLNRIFTPTFNDLLKVVKAKVDEVSYVEISEEFKILKEVRFSQFSD